MIPKFEINNWLGRIFKVHGQYAVLRPFISREILCMYGATLAVLYFDATNDWDLLNFLTLLSISLCINGPLQCSCEDFCACL